MNEWIKHTILSNRGNSQKVKQINLIPSLHPIEITIIELSITMGFYFVKLSNFRRENFKSPTHLLICPSTKAFNERFAKKDIKLIEKNGFFKKIKKGVVAHYWCEMK